MVRTAGILTLLSLAAMSFAQSGADGGTGSSPSFVSSASLQIKGMVSVNQQRIADASTVIAEGDRVETGSFAAARISAPGLSVYLPENSCLKYGGQELEICNCGSAEVNARKPVSLMFRDRDLIVSTQGGNAAFAVSVAGNDLSVVNQAGIVSVTRSGAVLTQLNSHSSRSLTGLGCRIPVNSFNSTAGTAAAIAAPASISGIVILRSTNRQPVSSLAP